MTTLIALAERVEGLQGPDREVDAEVFRALGWQPSFWGWNAEGDRYTPKQPDFTASLDAVCTLIAEKLPGWQTEQITWAPEPGGHVIASIGNFGVGDDYRCGMTEEPCATPALALLAAALRALSKDTER
ncbi:MAG: hypothetical protein LCH88_08965 [Proteobacteria bacterium]|nr:hypothetical protein [Pseudomonadota bacterium]